MRKLFFVLTAFLIAVLIAAVPVSALEEPMDIEINSNVNHATIFVDGNYFGETPCVFTGNYYGEEHSVEVSAQGYDTYYVTASAGKPVYAYLNMITGPVTPAPTNSPAPAIALIAGLGAAVFFAIRRD